MSKAVVYIKKIIFFFLHGEDVGSQEIPLYTASSEKPEYVLVSDLYNDIDSYANYYTVDVSEYGGDLLDNLDGYKVSSIYKKHTDGYLYKLNDFYFIGGSESGYPDTDDGLVYRIYTYNAAKTEDSFLYNKYLTNSKWRLYTTHKFTDKDGNTYNFEGYVFEIEKGETVEASYYLIPNKVSNKNKFTGRPNMPVTYFAENCKVTLGGGLTLTHTGINGKTVESGTITIE